MNCSSACITDLKFADLIALKHKHKHKHIDFRPETPLKS